MVGVLCLRWEDPYNCTKQLFPGLQLQDIKRAGIEEGKGGRWGCMGWTQATRERGCWMDKNFHEKGR